MLGLLLVASSGPVGAADSALVSVGSDTMTPLVSGWAGMGAAIQNDAGGSGLAAAALTEGRSQLAPMSRKMSDEELRAFEESRGYAPLRIQVAFDAIAIVVHPKNPLRGLTLRQLAGIFTADAACGGKPIERWGELVFGRLENAAIQRVGRDLNSGTRAFLRDALCGGSERPGTQTLPDSLAIVRAVADDAAAIGYAGLGFRNGQVRGVALAEDEESPYIPYFVEVREDDPDPAVRFAYVWSGRYPLSRPLYIYVDKAPGQALPEPVAAFLGRVLSAEGQEVVERAGFVPLSSKLAESQRAKLRPDYAPSFWDRWFGGNG